MKKYYGSPEYEIDIFNISNVITTSGDDGGLGDGDTNLMMKTLTRTAKFINRYIQMTL